MPAPPNPLDWLIWPHEWRGRTIGYDFGFWVEDRLWTLGNCKTPDHAERVIRSKYVPASITRLPGKPTDRL